MSYYHENLDPLTQINDFARISIDRIVASAYIYAKTQGIAPFWTGNTINKTQMKQKSSNDIYEGEIAVLTNYAEKIYYTGGVIPSGTPEWLKVAFEKAKPDEIIKNVFSQNKG